VLQSEHRQCSVLSVVVIITKVDHKQLYVALCVAEYIYLNTFLGRLTERNGNITTYSSAREWPFYSKALGDSGKRCSFKDGRSSLTWGKGGEDETAYLSRYFKGSFADSFQTQYSILFQRFFLAMECWLS
jgi:hypothetical protein